MISVFNGRSRSLGETSKREVHIQLSVTFRRYLNHFKGAQLGVFMSIALHADEKGWAWPRVSTISKETGYDENTVHKALNKLCLVKIRGRRVLLRAKEPPAHYVPDPRDKNYARNYYLLFPSDAEIARYEGEDDGGDENSNRLAKTVSTKSESFFLDIEKVDTVFASRSLNTKEEPSIKKNQREKQEPHTHEPEPAPAPPGTPTLFDEQARAQDGVCVPDDLTFRNYLDYARSQPSIHSPEGWAMKHYTLRDADVLVREWLDSQQPAAIAAARTAPANHNLYFGEAAQIVRSLLALGRDPRQMIADMPLDDEVRARLLAEFSPAEVSRSERLD